MAKKAAMAFVVLLLAIPATGFFVWLTVGGGAWLGNVDVVDVNRSNTGEINVGVDSCNGSPRPNHFEVVGETVMVQIEAFSTPLSGGDACLDGLRLSPIGEATILRDLTSGEEFEIPEAS